MIDGYAFLDKLDWYNYNKGTELKQSIELHHDRVGYYPASVHIDAIYRNRENLAYCKTRVIWVSGPKLGRPPKVVSVKDKKLYRQDARDGIPVEGKLGEGKRRYGLRLIMAKLQETSESVITMQFLVMNLAHLMRVIFALFSTLHDKTSQLEMKIFQRQVINATIHDKVDLKREDLIALWRRNTPNFNVSRLS